MVGFTCGVVCDSSERQARFRRKPVQIMRLRSARHPRPLPGVRNCASQRGNFTVESVRRGYGRPIAHRKLPPVRGRCDVVRCRCGSSFPLRDNSPSILTLGSPDSEPPPFSNLQLSPGQLPFDCNEPLIGRKIIVANPRRLSLRSGAAQTIHAARSIRNHRRAPIGSTQIAAHRRRHRL